MNGLELLLDGGVAANQLAVFEEGLVGGIDNERAVIAVQEQVGAALDLGAGILEADDGRDLEGAGHDGCVRRLAAGLGDKAQDQFVVQEGGF